MRLNQIISGIAITDRRGRLDCDIGQIVFDSRRVEPGDLFVAVRGHEADGHKYIRDAVAKGASAVLAEEWPEDVDTDGKRPDVVLVPDSRRALALAASNFTGQPSRKLLVAGVTGTNGKTTVTYILESIIRAASRKVGLIGTVECRYGSTVLKTPHTTPDPVFLESVLKKMQDDGVTHVVMEVSSHALDQYRVQGVHFKVAAFTNLSQDHLDYHESMDDYFKSKGALFGDVLRRSRARGRMAVVNIDDERGEDLIEVWGGKTLRVSMNPESEAEVCCLEAEYSLGGTNAKVRTPKGVWDIETALIGAHNLANVASAMGMALAMGFSKARIVRGLRALERVPGRLERVPNPDSKHIFVDYAHTPDALESVLGALRSMTEGRLIVVFGCGGDRDAEKRPLMGKAVAESADLAIVTNDNPRSEDPQAIANAIEKGLGDAGFSKSDNGGPKTYAVELDRRSAIRRALELMTDKDVLVIAGKGHEDYQIIGNERHRFDDREEARRIAFGEPPPPPEVTPIDDDEIEMLSADDVEEIGADEVVDSVEVVGTKEIIAEELDSAIVGASSVGDEKEEAQSETPEDDPGGPEAEKT